MFNSFNVKDPRSDRRLDFGRLSFIWAGLFGPVYVLLKAGPGIAAMSLILSLACAIGLFAFIVYLYYIPGPFQPIALIFVPLAVFVFHAVQTIGLIKSYYRKRKWSVRLT